MTISQPRRLVPALSALLASGSICPVGLAQAQRAGAVNTTPRTIRHSAGEYRVDAGHFSAPENRSRPDSRVIELAFGRLHSTAEKPGDPILYLAGGPGDSATNLASNPAWQSLLAVADVILLDQRGAGRSRPQLLWSPDDLLPTAVFGAAEGALKLQQSMAARARAHFESQGVDLGGYNTVESARDIDALCAALGVERVTLMAHSYGTHLALATLRMFPGRVKSLILAGTAGPDDLFKTPSELDTAFQRLSDLAKRDPSVAQSVPDLTALMRRVLEKLRRQPVTVTVQDPVSKATVDVPVGEHGLRILVLLDMGDVDDIPILPRLLYTIDQGDTTLLRWFVQKRFGQMRYAPMLAWMVRGASGASAERWKRIETQAGASLFGAARNWPPRELFETLGVRDLGNEFRAPVRSDAPALFVTGTLDANTPPEQAEAVRKGFPKSGHLIVENGGHEDLLFLPEVQTVVVEFLKSCAPRDGRVFAPPIRFVPVSGAASGFEHPALRAE